MGEGGKIKGRYTDLAGMDCSCGQSKMKRKPCKHEFSAANIAGVRIDARFCGSCFSPRTWRLQYQDIGNLIPLCDIEYTHKNLNIEQIPFEPKQLRHYPSNHVRRKRKTEIIERSMKRLKQN